MSSDYLPSRIDKKELYKLFRQKFKIQKNPDPKYLAIRRRRQDWMTETIFAILLSLLNLRVEDALPLSVYTCVLQVEFWLEVLFFHKNKNGQQEQEWNPSLNENATSVWIRLKLNDAIVIKHFVKLCSRLHELFAISIVQIFLCNSFQGI